MSCGTSVNSPLVAHVSDFSDCGLEAHTNKHAKGFAKQHLLKLHLTNAIYWHILDIICYILYVRMHGTTENSGHSKWVFLSCFNKLSRHCLSIPHSSCLNSNILFKCLSISANICVTVKTFCHQFLELEAKIENRGNQAFSDYNSKHVQNTL